MPEVKRVEFNLKECLSLLLGIEDVARLLIVETYATLPSDLRGKAPPKAKGMTTVCTMPVHISVK